jgi:hypothetical protein
MLKSGSPAATAATTTAGSGTGLGFVDANHATHPLDVLKIVDGFLLIAFGRHLHEGETALAAGVAIERNAALANSAILGEKALKVLNFGIEGEVPNVNGHVTGKGMNLIRGKP